MKQKVTLPETMVLVMVCIFIFGLQGVYAQFNAASIEGFVFDENGDPLEGALVEWRNNATGELITNFTSTAIPHGYYFMMHTYDGTIESMVIVSKHGYISNSTVISMTANFPLARYYANFTLLSVDTEAPETTVTAPEMTGEPTPIPAGHELNWTNTPITLSFRRIDSNSTGVAYTNLSAETEINNVDVNGTIMTIPQVGTGNLTINTTAFGETFNVTISNDVNVNIYYYSVDKNETPNVETAKNLTVRIDMTPPVGVSDLHETAVGSTWINWTWTNPPDPDFNHTMVYDGHGVWKANVSGAPDGTSYINTSDFCTFDPYTTYTILTRTVDVHGNINYTWVNDSARTQGHDVNVSTDYYPEGNGIKIKDDATGDWVLVSDNLTIGKLYRIAYQIRNDGDFDEANVNITVTATNDTAWTETVREHSTSLTVGQTKTFSAAKWDTIGLASGNYTIWVNASIPVDNDWSNNNRSREVTLEEAQECIPDMEVNKTVFNETSGTWEKWVNASLNDTLRFRVWIHNNATCCNLTDITVIDYLSNSLKYENGSGVPFEPNETAYHSGYTEMKWNFTRPLAYCQNITIEFNATVVGYGAGYNYAYVGGMCNGQGVNGDDSVDVYGLEDVTPPVITIFSPMNNTAYNTTSIPLNVSANEIANTWMYNRNSTGNVTFGIKNTTTANKTITVAEGANNIIVYANDTSGNMGRSSVVYFSVDTIAPTVTIDTPMEGFLTNIPTIAVNGTINEGATVKAYLNGVCVNESVSVNPYLTFNTTITLTEGQNTITITATDAAQNTGCDTVNGTLDTIAPTYEWVLRPMSGTTGESVLVNISATDNVGVTRYNITVDGAEHEMTKNGDYYTYTITIPSASTAEIMYNCAFGDEAGQTNTTADMTIAVTDNDEPAYGWVSRPDTGTTGESVLVNVSVSDNIGVTRYNITVDGVEYVMTKNNGYYTYLINIPSGSTAEIVYNCTFGDEAGQTNTTQDTTIAVTDNDDPIIVMVALDNYEVAQGELINVLVNASDNVGVVTVTADGIPLSLVAGTPQRGQWYGTLTAPSDAWIYTVIVEAKDAANNTAINDTVQYTTWELAKFDTDAGTYPSIAGIHTGFIIPNHTVVVKKMYTYPCAGTGGHAEYVEISNGTWSINATWNGYKGDYHNITFAEIFTLVEGQKYSYEIRTGSYPQIIHTQNRTTADGYINCTSFVDVNGNDYGDWIPAVRLFP